jgi:hypothetical protein
MYTTIIPEEIAALIFTDESERGDTEVGGTDVGGTDVGGTDVGDTDFGDIVMCIDHIDNEYVFELLQHILICGMIIRELDWNFNWKSDSDIITRGFRRLGFNFNVSSSCTSNVTEFCNIVFSTGAEKEVGEEAGAVPLAVPLLLLNKFHPFRLMHGMLPPPESFLRLFGNESNLQFVHGKLPDGKIIWFTRR